MTASLETTYVLTPGLLAATVMVVFVGYAIARRHLSPAASITIACLKAMIPLVYFLDFYDGSWYFLDDFVYEQQGKDMIAAGYNPWSAVATDGGRDLLSTLSGGRHVLYGWWNLLAQWTFGQTYWAPVFLNVVLTFVVGFATARMLEDLGFHRQYVRGFLVLFLLHLEVLAWSSFVNLKDILILTLTALALRSIVALARLWKERGFRRRRELFRGAVVHVLLFSLLSLAISYVRFYVPLLLLAVVAAWSVLSLPGWRRVGALIAAVMVGLWILDAFTGHRELIKLSGLPWGLLRFSLTPRPWATDANYSFLILPAILHWMLFVPMVAAGITLWIKRPLARLPLAYLVVAVVLFAAVPELHGPRHRIQILPIIVWLEFHAIWWCISLPARGERADTPRVNVGPYWAQSSS